MLGCLEDVNHDGYFFKLLFQVYRCVPDLFFAIVLTVINKVNDLRVWRDSLVKYKIIFLIDVVLGVAVVVSYIL